MVEPLTIVIGIIFVIVVLIIIVGLVAYNRNRSATELITNFGLTIKNNSSGLYMSMEMIRTAAGVEPENIFPIMILKSIPSGQDPEPTEGWILTRTLNNPTDNLVTFFNPSTSGYITYDVDANGNIVGGIIRTDAVTPVQPVPGDNLSFIGWFELSQTNNITTFKSLFPGSIKGQNQYLIPGNLGQIATNPNTLPVTIGIPSNNNNQWIVGQANNTAPQNK